jgi:hypothetical protein
VIYSALSGINFRLQTLPYLVRTEMQRRLTAVNATMSAASYSASLGRRPIQAALATMQPRTSLDPALRISRVMTGICTGSTSSAARLSAAVSIRLLVAIAQGIAA